MEEKKTCHCNDETCDCGCNHDDCECENVVEFTDENGKVIKCALIETVDYKGKTYAAFELVDEVEDEEADTVYIYEVIDNEDGETSDLVPVEDEALLDEVFEELCNLLDAEEEEISAEEQSNL